MLLKIFYISIYFLITEMLPAVGVSWDLSDPTVILIQKIFLVLLATILFKNDLWFQLKEMRLKDTSIPIFVTFVFMILTYLLVVKILDTSLIIGKYNVSLIFMLDVIVITPIVEEIVFRYCFINSRKNSLIIIQILLSSLWFMYGHAAAANYNYILLIPYFVLGTLLSLIYVWKKIFGIVYWHMLVIILSCYLFLL